MVGSAHDFVDNGFTGGGVCVECHVPHAALGVRLWPRAVTGTLPAPAILCMECHSHGGAAINTFLGGAWSTVASVVRTVPHNLNLEYPAGTFPYRNCTAACHRHN